MSKKILIIESDEFYIEVIGTFVRLFLQYEFVPTKSAKEAMDRVHQEHPDLVMVDLDMDGHEAVEFSERMRDDAETKNIPIIAISQDGGRRDEALGTGCSAFLAKPFKIRELEAMIMRLLGEV